MNVFHSDRYQPTGTASYSERTDRERSRARFSKPDNRHVEAVEAVVNDGFGIQTKAIHERYSELVADAKTRRTVMNHLQDLRDAGRILPVGEHADRRYYPVPDDEIGLPPGVGAREAAVAIDESETVHDLASTLFIDRQAAFRVLKAFGQQGTLENSEPVDIHNPLLDQGDEMQRVTVRLPDTWVDTLETAVENGSFASKSQAIRTGIRPVVEGELNRNDTL